VLQLYTPFQKLWRYQAFGRTAKQALLHFAGQIGTFQIFLSVILKKYLPNRLNRVYYFLHAYAKVKPRGV
jgi:hypothetical protein